MEKDIIKKALLEKGFFNRVSQRTISFQDLARDKKVFVFVHDWKGHPFFNDLKLLGKQFGFIVSTK